MNDTERKISEKDNEKTNNIALAITELLNINNVEQPIAMMAIVRVWSSLCLINEITADEFSAMLDQLKSDYKRHLEKR